MIFSLLIGVVLLHSLQSVAHKIQVPKRSYSCLSSGQCQLNSESEGVGVSQGVCLLTCGKGNIWPYPTKMTKFGNTVAKIGSAVEFNYDKRGGSAEFDKLAKSMENNWKLEIGKIDKSLVSSIANLKGIKVTIEIADKKVLNPSPNNDESYDLSIEEQSDCILVSISSNTIFGMRHALETLSQLIVWDDLSRTLAIASDVAISDAPSFRYRGVMIDVSRHFISLSKLLESVRALGYNKMNVLHLHLSDTASIPVTTPSRRNVTMYGAYDNDKIFTIEDMSELVSIAKSYGVMILPEIDAPAHMSAGWQWGPSAGLGDLVLCADPDGHGFHQWDSDSLEPPSGQLNLANENSFVVLDDIYHDVISQFPSPFFHIGGDEVIVGSDSTWASCYNSSTRGKPIIDMLENNGLSRNDQSSFYSLWENFTIRATKMVQNQYESQQLHMDKLHIWGGGGVDSSGVCYNLLAQDNLESFLPPSIFNIQVWDETDGSVVPSLIDKGYDVVLSNTDYVYLDCGNAGFTNPGGYWCQPYHEWFHIYQYISDITTKWSLSSEMKKRIFGSETLIWTEMVDDNSVSQKLWPRSAALAEALWSDPSNGWFEANSRMQMWRNTMVARGIAAEALQPLWCQQRTGDICALNTGNPG